MTPRTRSGQDSTTRAQTALCTGQEHREAAALSLPRLDRDTPAVGFGDPAHDGQPEARAAALPVRLTVGVEDVWQRVGRDADPRILDLQLELRARVDHAGDDAAAGRGEADRVGAEVHDDLMQTLEVAGVREARSDALALERHGGLRGQRVKLLDGPIDQLREIERAPFELDQPGLQARHLEDLIHEPEQSPGADRDDVGEPPLLVGERSGYA